jgi:hypothetical protein
MSPGNDGDAPYEHQDGAKRCRNEYDQLIGCGKHRGLSSKKDTATTLASAATRTASMFGKMSQACSSICANTANTFDPFLVQATIPSRKLLRPRP